ncbi:14-3-3-like protein C, partial [Pseudolycoriella hygida]
MEQKFRKDLASIMARKKREKYVYEARIAKAAHRPNDMVDAVKKLALLNVGLTTDERNLFSTAYHLKIGALRRARKRASSFGKNEVQWTNLAGMILYFKSFYPTLTLVDFINSLGCSGI